MPLRRNELCIVPILFLGTLAIYLWCGAPSVMYGDSAELQTVALKGGVAHPTGYPTFIMAGQVFGRVLRGDAARRITIMSSIFGAAAVCALLLVLLKFGIPQAPAVAGALIYAASDTFWWSAIRTEVYTLAICLFLISLWCVLHAFEKPTRGRAALAGASMGLTLTGHFAFAPAVIVMLLALALRIPPDRASLRTYYLALLIGFVGGLTPYLRLAWADHARYPMNYLNYSIELGSGQFGLTARTFGHTWERILWLIFGQESRPTLFLFHLRLMLRQVLRVLVLEFLYHFGPLALPVFVAGCYRVIRTSGRKGLILFGITGASVVFGAGIGSARMLQIFLMAETIGLAIILSFGLWFILETIHAGRRARRFASAVVFLVLVSAMIVLPHMIRAPMDRAQSFLRGLKPEVEGEPKIDSAIPQLREFWEPRDYGENVLRLIPKNSFVVGKWKEIMVLYYLHLVEGRRPDIELEPYYPAHLIRLTRWQETHDPSTHPIVFLSRIPGLTESLAGLDSVKVDYGGSLYICRKPLSGN